MLALLWACSSLHHLAVLLETRYRWALKPQTSPALGEKVLVPLWNRDRLVFWMSEIAFMILPVTKSKRKMERKGIGWMNRTQWDTSSTKSARSKSSTKRERVLGWDTGGQCELQNRTLWSNRDRFLVVREHFRPVRSLADSEAAEQARQSSLCSVV
jgi:hypothetical protein